MTHGSIMIVIYLTLIIIRSHIGSSGDIPDQVVHAIRSTVVHTLSPVSGQDATAGTQRALGTTWTRA